MTDLYQEAVQKKKELAEINQAYHRLRDAVALVSRAAQMAWNAATEEARQDPQPGDLWSEMCSFWLYVVARRGDRITTLSRGAPCSFPEDGELEEMTLDQWRERYSYLYLDSRGHNVTGWERRAKKKMIGKGADSP